MSIKLKNDQLFVVALLFIIFLYVCFHFMSNTVSETFSDGVTKLDQLIGDESMSQRHDLAKKELLVNSVDDSIDRVRKEQGILKFENANTNSKLLDEYINKVLLDDIGNPNKLLEEGTNFELPTVIEDDFNKYNHELRLMNISKQVKQDYILKVLRHKIELMLNSLKPVMQIKQELEDLRLPENKHIVKILSVDSSKDKDE